MVRSDFKLILLYEIINESYMTDVLKSDRFTKVTLRNFTVILGRTKENF